MPMIKKLWYMYTMENYSTIKRNTFVSILMRWLNREPIIQSEVSQKEKDKYHILTHIWRRQWHPTPVVLPVFPTLLPGFLYFNPEFFYEKLMI